jgi:hypothetical protein
MILLIGSNSRDAASRRLACEAQGAKMPVNRDVDDLEALLSPAQIAILDLEGLAQALPATARESSEIEHAVSCLLLKWRSPLRE